MGDAVYRINPLTAEFAEPHAEKAFIDAEQATTVRYLKVVMAISAAFFMLYGLIDYTDLGSGTTFWIMMAARAEATSSAASAAKSLPFCSLTATLNRPDR